MDTIDPAYYTVADGDGHTKARTPRFARTDGWMFDFLARTWRRSRNAHSRKACCIRRWSRVCCTSTRQGVSRRS